jgi:F-box/leucine-rich repeat protein 10/11
MPGTNAYVNANIPMAMNGVPMFGDVAKRGRSKACFECRKSKVSIPYFATHRHLAHVLIPE